MNFDLKKLGKDALGVIAYVAPTIATALGGPLAGAAVGALSEAVLGKPDGTEKEIAEVLLAGDANAILRLKEADNAFKIRMGELKVDIERINAGDRDSARKREIITRDNTPRILAFSVLAGFLGSCIALFISAFLGREIPPALATMIGAVIGYLSAKSDFILSYYYGGSVGSDVKTRIMGDMLKGKDRQ